MTEKERVCVPLKRGFEKAAKDEIILLLAIWIESDLSCHYKADEARGVRVKYVRPPYPRIDLDVRKSRGNSEVMSQ